MQLFLLLSFFACKSKAQKLADFKTERTDLITNLYSEYGGSDIKNNAEKVADETKAEDKEGLLGVVMSTISKTVSEVDKESFVNHCQTLGRGEETFIITDKAKNFFNRDDVKKRCKRVHVVETKIAQLESEI